MKPEQWPQIDRLFQAAVERPPEERAAFLDEACQGDEDLRLAVESMLASDEQAESFIEAPAFEVAASILMEEKTKSLVSWTISHYRIISLLGRGGMGEVYLAEDTALERKVAIKILPDENPEGARRLKREALAAAALDHPHISAIYEVGEEKGRSFIVMQYIEGETLAARMHRQPLSFDETLSLAMEAADALAEAHAHQIMHRDIKPANIIIDARGHAKVLDFGLARRIRSEAGLGSTKDSQSVLSIPGIIVGTPAYMSPEQMRGEELDARTDIFSFGVMLYEMISSAHPFARESSAETAAAIQLLEPPPLARYAPDVPAEIARIVSKALVKERKDRYQTIKELLEDLRAFKGENNVAGATAKAENLVGRIRRRKTSLAFALLALVVVMTVVAYFSSLISQKFQTSPPPHRPLTQLTYGGGLQTDPTWSPDGRMIAYSSDRGGNFDIWVQQIGGGNPIQVTKSIMPDWQPDWSPDGTNIVFRSERDGGGLYVIPALGGKERKISSFGYRPQWSPDGSQIMFYPSDYLFGYRNKVYLVALDGESPREVQPEFLGGFLPVGLGGVAWHPDGKRISVWGHHAKLGQGFWTMPLTGGVAVKSEMTGEVEKGLKETDVRLENFVWAPSGRYLYFEGWAGKSINNWRNLWRVTVDPLTLRWVAGPERLTTDTGFDTVIALSPNGKKLAYTSRNRNTRIWSLPLDAVAGKIKGAGQPVTAAGMAAYLTDLSRDGKKLSFWVGRASKVENWEKSIEDGHEQLLAVEDEFVHDGGCWSRDGKRLVTRRHLSHWNGSNEVVEYSTVIYPAGGGDEVLLTSPTTSNDGCYDWSADGQWVLGFANPLVPGRSLIWLLPVAAAPRAETQARVVTSSEEYNLWQTRFSPDERWVSFVAEKHADGGLHIFIVPASGGEWTRITEGKHWDDKPRWAPDGRTIYFISDRTGFLNVWGIHFNPLTGKPVGEPFLVTNFESTGQMIDIELAEFGVSANRLVVTFKESSGSIWTLENVDR